MFCEGKSHEVLDFSYNGKKEEYKVCTATPVICTDNMKDHGTFNSQMFTVQKFSVNSVIIKENGEKFVLD